MTAILRADTLWTYIYGNIPYPLIDSVTSYKVYGAWFSPKYKKGYWDGFNRFREYDRKLGIYKFPTGFLERVTKNLDEHEIVYQLEDSRIIDSPDPIFEMADGINLDYGKYDYQAEVVSAACIQGRGVIKLATGMGKSRTGAGIVKSFDRPTIWFTDRRLLAYQAKKTLEAALGEPVGLVGDMERDIRKVTVCIAQTLKIHKDDPQIQAMKELAEVLILDECHHLEADAWYDHIMEMPAPYRFGLTATPALGGAGLRLIAACGDLLCDLGIEEGIERGVLCPGRIWWVDYLQNTDAPKTLKGPSLYKRCIVEWEPRNLAILQVAETFRDEGLPAITLTKQTEHGKYLTQLFNRKGLKTEFIHGQLTQSKREKFIKALETKKLDHIVANVAILGEGVDMPFLRGVINATGQRGGGSGASKKEDEVGRTTIQAYGRGLRNALGKPWFDYVDFNDTYPKKLNEARQERSNALSEVCNPDRQKQWSERWTN